jgi:hypothetical protein
MGAGFTWIIGLRPAYRMRPDGKIALRDRIENRSKARRVECDPANMGTDLEADCAEPRCALDFHDGSFGIEQGQGSGEGGKAIGMPTHEFGETVIHEAHQIDGSLPFGEIFEGRAASRAINR